MTDIVMAEAQRMMSVPINYNPKKRKAGADLDGDAKRPRIAPEEPREEKEGYSSPTQRSYIQFPRGDCVLQAKTATRIEKLRKVLEKEGLLPHLKFKIEGRRIFFQHSREELIALGEKYPKLIPYFSNNDRIPCFFRETVKVPRPSKKGLSESINPKIKLVRSLVQQANRYFQENPVSPPVNFTFKTDASDKENLQAVYKQFQGLCLGETHSDINPKKFLLENMETLRDLGVKTLFMEDFLYDTQQTLLDQYFQATDQPFLLQVFVEHWTATYGFPPLYGYEEILKKAKQCGIRIVGIDTSIANEVDTSEYGKKDPMERLRTMNFVAQQIIAKEKGDGKYLALMGSLHATTITQFFKNSSTRVAYTSPGMADLLQCPLIVIEDNENGQEKTPRVNISRIDNSEVPAWHEKHIHLHLQRSK